MVANVIRRLLVKLRQNKKVEKMKATKKAAPAAKKVIAKVKPVAVIAVGKIKKAPAKKKK